MIALRPNFLIGHTWFLQQRNVLLHGIRVPMNFSWQTRSSHVHRLGGKKKKANAEEIGQLLCCAKEPPIRAFQLWLPFLCLKVPGTSFQSVKPCPSESRSGRKSKVNSGGFRPSLTWANEECPSQKKLKCGTPPW